MKIKGDTMYFEDEEKRKRAKLLMKTCGVLMAIGFMLMAAFMEQIGPFLGLSKVFSASTILKYLFFVTVILDLLVFTFIIK